VRFEYYAWWVQLGVTVLFAAHLARMARRKGRHPVGAALLMLTFANGWPLVFEAVGRLVSAAFALKDEPRTVLVRVFGYGGVMFGVAVSYAIIGCLKPIGPARRPDGRGVA
jgi:hypothetical protein